MDWQLAINRNREALLRVIAMLFALAGLGEGRAMKTLPRHAYRAVLRVLRPAESAVRRLIFIAARGLVLVPRPLRAAPIGLAPSAVEGVARHAAFGLIDPLKSFMPFADHPDNADYDEDEENPEDSDWNASLPRISVPGFFDPVFVSALVSSSEDPIDARRLARRLHTLKHALDTLPKQARRLARWFARRDLIRQQAPLRIGRLSPLRPGRPPGYQLRQRHEVDEILRECHALALDVQADTS